MTKPILNSSGFAAAIIDALSSNICVIDKDGVIVTVNRAWRNFAEENPPRSRRTGLGTNYLEVCRVASGPGSEGAMQFASGVESVLNGAAELFQMEYPCHSPTQNRWFLGRVTRLKGARRGAVISHANITERKLLELELVRLAETDALTGLPNRRYFLETANLEVERVRRFGTVASLIMVDVDRFKAVNDTYGHAAGDEALRCLASVGRSSLRQVDMVARLGGEEFVVILPGTGESGALAVADKLRRAVSEMSVSAGASQFNISASFGVAQVRADDQDVEACLARADTALYAAKQTGRNCVMSFTAAAREA
jgi:diguanylate cyclase (GGDEF)-like protein